jgi:hypothetical protein
MFHDFLQASLSLLESRGRAYISPGVLALNGVVVTGGELALVVAVGHFLYQFFFAH